ncbi:MULTISPECIES: CARDB domain-containing protein [unclassified Paenibacillus]|uniref:glycoside hydrolase family 78 protein n=1 Tax=unclassified Paenibacillus TaxID=185978 RepID=UPI001AE48833|nr:MULTISPECIES: CARDB domain-containing protein [unclassified Paenibacillus]MBP1157123.1 hypothetical protein [Paenibacillus sp. PvP091]MBP1172138.1 hypothetical protein [Paenibacillus sp. PvR098]MBP2438519.1 hypothetical protein [Paenibacillus sp. PvP052]
MPNGKIIESEKIDKNTIEIYDAGPVDDYENRPNPFYWGKSKKELGKGDVKVRMHLSNDLRQASTQEFFDGDYYINPSSLVPPYGHDRNYLMGVRTFWKALTYTYEGYVEIEYDLSKPDLVAQDIKSLNGQPEIGVPATLQLTIGSQGKAVKPDDAFVVKVFLRNATQLYSHTFRGSDFSGSLTISDTFIYTFPSVQPQEFILHVDYYNQIAEENENNNKKNVTITPGFGIKGKFNLTPSTIKYREPFTLTPRDFEIPAGCTYNGHYYKIARTNGDWWITPKVMGEMTSSTHSYPAYRDYILVGENRITLKISTNCGDTDWIDEKPLNVIEDPNNEPPVFTAGWFYDGDRRSVQPPPYFVVGDMVNVRIINEPNATPPRPYDPDNDPIFYQWHFFTNTDPWIKKVGEILRGQYGNVLNDEHYGRILADEAGEFFVQVTGSDGRGGETTRSAWMSVLEPNPIPVCSVPAKVKENRPVPVGSIHANKSWSPPNRSIDHAKDVWTNKLDRYPNGTLQDVIATVTLEKVTDSSGLESKSTSTCSILVHPDFPPIAKIPVPSVGIRNQKIHVPNQSYSPDGDIVVFMSYKYKYDSNNNGFADDTWQLLTGSMNGFDFTPMKVGRYLFYAYACEDYGKCGDTREQPEASLMLDVLNDAPEVSFTVDGKNQQPDLNPPQAFPASTILSRWSLFHVNSNQSLSNRSYAWSIKNGVLSAGAGKGMEKQYEYWNSQAQNNSTSGPYITFTAFQDAGLGPNSISPYKGMISSTRDLSRSQPILTPYPRSTDVNQPYTGLIPAEMGKLMRSNETHLYFDQIDDYYKKTYFYAYNKHRVPRHTALMETGGQGSQAQGRLVHKWLDPSPYDYMLDVTIFPEQARTNVPVFTTSDQSRDPNFRTKASNGDFSGASSSTPVNGGAVQKYEVSGETLYVIYKINRPSYYYQAYGEDGIYATPGGYHEGYSGSQDIVAVTYDLHTGAYISHSNVSSNPMFIKTRSASDQFQLMPKGDNMIVFVRYDYNGAMDYIEYDRNGKVVTYGNLAFPTASFMYTYSYVNWMGNVVSDSTPQPYYCSYRPNIEREFYKDDSENVYFFAFNTCRQVSGDTNKDLNQYNHADTPVGLYVMKVNMETFAFTPLARTSGNSTNYPSQSPFSIPSENLGIMSLNSFTGDLFARTFRVDSTTLKGEFNERININTGSKSVWGIALKEAAHRFVPNFFMRTDAQYPSGRCTYTSSGSCDWFDWHHNEIIGESWNAAGTNRDYAIDKTFGQYIGDGQYLSIYGGNVGGNKASKKFMFLDVGTPQTNEIFNGIKLGQFVSDVDADHMQVTFSMTLRKPAASQTKLAGYSFRMLDPMNRYAVESDGNTVYLSRYVGGNLTVLRSAGYPFAANQAYSFRIKAVGSRIDVWLNGIPVFSDVQDTTFTSGKMGPFTDKPYVDFGGISSKAVSEDIQWLSNYVIWEEGTATAEVRYNNITFTDPENDPIAGSYQWNYMHTPKFLKHQGLSSLNGQTFSSERLTFDKVGLYAVTLRAKDDPFPAPQYKYPNMTFDSYRKNSNPFQQMITVHRRPIAQFTLSTGSGGIINWNDTSYDPDRYDPATHTFSSSDEGKIYTSNRGVFERKYWYAKPSGVYVEGKLTRPDEAGTYEVFLSVRDEYGAWSQPASQTMVSAGNVPQNAKPTATLTFPNGTNAAPSLLFTSKPQIQWNQYDTAGTVFQGYHVKVMHENGQIYTESGEAAQSTTSNSASWNVPIDLPVGVKLQVQVRVSDGEAWSEWSNIGWMRVNSPPTATLTYPNGANETTPNIINTRQPTLSWIQNDIDGQSLRSFRLQIIQRHSHGAETIVYDVTRAQNDPAGTKHFTVDSDLPNGVLLYAKVMVSDGFLWSNGSNIGWFRINFAPAVHLTFPTGTYAYPSIGGVLPLITWNQTDPDPDTSYSRYQVIIARENGTVLVDTGQILQNTRTGHGSYQVHHPLPSGIKVQVKVKIWDEYTESAWSPLGWMYTNRSPTGNLTFLTPIYEHDRPTFTVSQTDPDGDAMRVLVEASFNGGAYTQIAQWDDAASGARQTFTYGPLQQGNYTLRLSLDDRNGGTYSQIYTFAALPLHITGWVNHTPEWESYRQTWNAKYPQQQRGTGDFWAGEAFELSAQVTDTGVSTTKPQYLDVTLMETGENVLLASGDDIRFTGQLLNTDHARLLQNGEEYTFRFRVRWTNGLEQTTEVPISIVGSIYDVIVNQIRH